MQVSPQKVALASSGSRVISVIYEWPLAETCFRMVIFTVDLRHGEALWSARDIVAADLRAAVPSGGIAEPEGIAGVVDFLTLVNSPQALGGKKGCRMTQLTLP